MSEIATVLIYITCIVSGVLLIVLATIGELWAVWAERGYRVQLTLRTLLMVLTAASLALAMIAPSLASEQWAGAMVLGALAFPFLLALVFFAEMLLGELYHTLTGASSRGMRVYRRTEVREMQTDEAGRPLCPQEEATEQAAPRRRPRTPRLAPLPTMNPFKVSRGS
jgi:hypothetical protein